MTHDELGQPIDAELDPSGANSDADEIEASRLADALATIEEGDRAAIDPTEDPALASLAATTQLLRRSLELSGDRASFEAFHARSRRHVLAATPQTRLELAGGTSRGSLLQRWNGLFTSVASAASAAIATFVVTVLAIGGGASTEPLASVQLVGPSSDSVADTAAADIAQDEVEPHINLTALSVDDQLVQYELLIAQLRALNDDGQPANADLLRSIAATSATVARVIQEQPAAVSGQTAWDAYHATFKGQQVLNMAVVSSEEDQVALDTAQVVADGAFVTAARYLENPGQAPTYQDTLVRAP